MPTLLRVGSDANNAGPAGGRAVEGVVLTVTNEMTLEPGDGGVSTLGVTVESSATAASGPIGAGGTIGNGSLTDAGRRCSTGTGALNRKDVAGPGGIVDTAVVGATVGDGANVVGTGSTNAGKRASWAAPITTVVVVVADPATGAAGRVVTGASAAEPAGTVVGGKSLCGAARRVAFGAGTVVDGGEACGAG